MASKPSWLDDEESASTTKERTTSFGIAGSTTANPSFSQTASKDASKSKSSYMPSWSRSANKDSKSVTKESVVATPAGGDGNEVRESEMPDQVPFEATPEEISKMNNWRYILSFVTLTAAVNLAVSAGLSLVGQTNISLAFFALYVLFFSGMILVYEFSFGRISKYYSINFGFMYTSMGRLFFVAFVGCMALSYSLYGIISAAILWLSYALYIYIRCTNRKFEEYVRKRNYNQKGIRD